MARMVLTVLTLLLFAGCAEPQAAPAPPFTQQHAVPAKCTACHLAPREHSLASDRWQRFERNHRRRVRLSPEEKRFLYGFLVGGELPEAPDAQRLRNEAK